MQKSGKSQHDHRAIQIQLPLKMMRNNQICAEHSIQYTPAKTRGALFRVFFSGLDIQNM